MKLYKVPRHIWLGVVLPLVLLGLGGWRLWPQFVEYRLEDELRVISTLDSLGPYETDDVDPKGWSMTVGWYGEVSEFSVDILEGEKLAGQVAEGQPFRGYQIVGIRSPLPSGQAQFCGLGAGGSHESAEGKTHVHVCAYPAVYDWRHRRTFIFHCDSRLYASDTGGDPVTRWPTVKELNEDWEKVDWVYRTRGRAP